MYKFKACIYCLLLIGISLTPIFANQENEQTTLLTFSILPVRFVYLDNNGEIVKIWNNVEHKHKVYHIEFFDNKTEEKISPTNKQLNSYYEIIKNSDPFLHGEIFNIKFLNIPGGNKKFETEFIKTQESITEIHTILN